MRWISLLIIAACLTQQDIKNSECSIACRGIGADTGRFYSSTDVDFEDGGHLSNVCGCINYRAYRGLIGRRPVVLPKKKQAMGSRGLPEYHVPWDEY